MPETFYAMPKDGKLQMDEPGRWAGYLAKNAGKRLKITIERPGNKRSLSQNRLLWRNYREGLAGLEEYSGHSEKELHEFLKGEYCPETEVVVAGVRRMVRSTALLDKEQMSSYIERCLAFFAQLGIRIEVGA